MIAARRRSSRSRQLRLFAEDEVIPLGAARCVIGDFFEELTCQVVRGSRLHGGNKGDICPDIQASTPPGAIARYVEVKSVGRSGVIPFFDRRWEKDRDLIETGEAELIYAFWFHKAKLGAVQPLTVPALRFHLASTIRHLVLFHALTVHNELCRLPRCETRNSSGGYRGWGSEGYRHYRRLNAYALWERECFTDEAQTKLRPDADNPQCVKITCDSGLPDLPMAPRFVPYFNWTAQP